MSLSCPETHVSSLIVSLLAMFASGAAIAGPELEGTFKIVAEIHGAPVAVIAVIDDAQNCANPRSVQWGVEGECPRHRLSSLSVQNAGSNGIVAMSAYSDLAAVRQIEVHAVQGGFEVTLIGGNAATGYKAVLKFSTKNSMKVPVLVSRVVRSSTNPKGRVDRFAYQFGPIDAKH